MLPPDPDTIRRAQDGDGDAFAALAAHYSDNVLAFFTRSVGDRDEAKDLLQETLIRAWAALPNYLHTGRLDAWLFTIARRVATDRGRSAQRRRHVAIPEGLAQAQPSPLQLAEAADLETYILAALAELPEQRRHVFLLRQHSSLTFREIAQELDIPLGTALSHMRLAVRHLEARLRKHAP